MREPEFKRINRRTRRVKGRSVSIVSFKKGSVELDVTVDSCDHVLQLTTRPLEWLDKKLVTPTGFHDSDGAPVYQVLELNGKLPDIPVPTPEKRKSVR